MGFKRMFSMSRDLRVRDNKLKGGILYQCLFQAPWYGSKSFAGAWGIRMSLEVSFDTGKMYKHVQEQLIGWTKQIQESVDYETRRECEIHWDSERSDFGRKGVWTLKWIVLPGQEVFVVNFCWIKVALGSPSLDNFFAGNSSIALLLSRDWQQPSPARHPRAQQEVPILMHADVCKHLRRYRRFYKMKLDPWLDSVSGR